MISGACKATYHYISHESQPFWTLRAKATKRQAPRPTKAQDCSGSICPRSPSTTPNIKYSRSLTTHFGRLFGLRMTHNIFTACQSQNQASAAAVWVLRQHCQLDVPEAAARRLGEMDPAAMPGTQNDVSRGDQTFGSTRASMSHLCHFDKTNSCQDREVLLQHLGKARIVETTRVETSVRKVGANVCEVSVCMEWTLLDAAVLCWRRTLCPGDLSMASRQRARAS